jgi:hypothetical protein
MPKANKGKRLLNLPEAAQYSIWSYQRGVEHGKREGRKEVLAALESLSAEIKADIERKMNDEKQ